MYFISTYKYRGEPDQVWEALVTLNTVKTRVWQFVFGEKKVRTGRIMRKKYHKANEFWEEYSPQLGDVIIILVNIWAPTWNI